MAARILVVDDEPMVRALIVRALTDEGYEAILHIDDLVRRDRLINLPADIPTIYKPFSIAALTGTVRKLLARD